MKAAVYRVRLEDSKSGEKRFTAAAASSEDEAVESVETKEQKHVRFMLDPVEAVEFEKRLRTGQLTGRDKARLFSHQQERPYKVMKVVKA